VSEPKVTRTLIRGLSVLECFADTSRRSGMSLADVSIVSGLDKATCLRLLVTLRAAGYLHRDDVTGLYSLTSRLLRLSQGISRHAWLIDVARPHLERSRDRFGEVVHLGVMEHQRIVYIDKLDTNQKVQLVSAVGQDMPLNTTALGKAFLAHLTEADPKRIRRFAAGFEERTPHSIVDADAMAEELRLTRKRDYSIDDNENQPGVLCVGGLIRTISDGPVAAISISGPEYRMRDRVKEVGSWIREVVQRIGEDLDLTSSPAAGVG
jgi:IclR family transcriptional regulator, KDG regulon repressor